MTLENLANIGEFISGIAVIVSLIYLAFQIRNNTRSVRVSTRANNTDTWAHLLVSLQESGSIGAYIYGASGRDDIHPKEHTQFLLQCRALFVSMENQYLHFLNGALEKETFKGYERSICQEILAFKGFRMYWKLHRQNFSPLFISYMDELIDKSPELEGLAPLNQWAELSRQWPTPAKGE